MSYNLEIEKGYTYEVKGTRYIGTLIISITRILRRSVPRILVKGFYRTKIIFLIYDILYIITTMSYFKL